MGIFVTISLAVLDADIKIDAEALNLQHRGFPSQNVYQ